MTESFTVSVGKPAKEFTIVKSIATRSSKYFQAALEKCWKEGHKNRVELSEHCADAFEGYLQWLYTKEITLAGGRKVSYEECQLYILGDYLGDQSFCNAVIDHAVSRWIDHKFVMCTHATKLVWSSTPEGSPLRTLVFEMLSNYPPSKAIENLKRHHSCCNNEFLLEYFEQLVRSQRLDTARRFTIDDKKQVGEKVKRLMS